MNAEEAIALITKISLVDSFVTPTADRGEVWAEVLQVYSLDEAWAAAKPLLRRDPKFNMASLVAEMNANRYAARPARITREGIIPGGPDGALLRGEIES